MNGDHPRLARGIPLVSPGDSQPAARLMTECPHLHIPAGDPEADRIGLGAVALRYASLGFCVLPAARGGKRPHKMLGGSGGVHHATTDPERIRAWWRQDRAASIAVACGTPPGLCVLDLDVKGEQAGADPATTGVVRA